MATVVRGLLSLELNSCRARALPARHVRRRFAAASEALRPKGDGKDHPWVNPRVIAAEYAVRGPLLIRSEEIQDAMAKGTEEYPFNEIIACNIGNPQAMLQKPITYYRQVSALFNCPSLLEDEAFLKSGAFPPDVIARVRQAVKELGHPNKSGAYSESLGYKFIRERLAKALEARDGVPANPNDFFLTDGASVGIKNVLQLLISESQDGVMIPIPQYPLYTATIAILGGRAVPYYLKEEGGWSLDLDSLKESYDKAVAEGTVVKAIAIINPGNPTGNLLSPDDLKAVCSFCSERGLLLMSDEVYQENVYRDGDKFVSAKEVVAKHFPDLSLVSFHSVSKGVIGECGKRGGYMEVYNIPDLMQKVLLKLASISLCPNVTGQLLVDLMMSPPKPGEESYELWKEEYDALWNSLKKRAAILAEGLNGTKGIHTNEVTGAMYAFPSLTLPDRFVEEAKSLNRAADVHWCFKLLENTGIVVVPGTGFGQRPGTSHFRITILPPEDKMQKVIELITKFQDKLFAEYQ